MRFDYFVTHTQNRFARRPREKALRRWTGADRASPRWDGDRHDLVPGAPVHQPALLAGPPHQRRRRRPSHAPGPARHGGGDHAVLRSAVAGWPGGRWPTSSTQGRLEIGFRPGGFRYEYERLGMTEPLAAARQQEALEVILRAWTETYFAYAGTYFKFPDGVTVAPALLPDVRARRRGSPPARRTACGFAAQHGIGIMMAPQRQPISRLQGQMRLLDAICEDLGVVGDHRCGSTREILGHDEPGRGAARSANSGWPSTTGSLSGTSTRTRRPPWTGSPKLVPLPSGYDISPEELIARGVIGDPDHCVERIRQYEALGADAFVPNMDWGQPQADILRSLELFAERVLPHFADDRPPRSPGPSWAPGRTLPADHPRAGTHRHSRAAGGLGHVGVDEWLAQFDRASSTAGGGATSSTSPRQRCGLTPTGRSTSRGGCASSLTRGARSAAARSSRCTDAGTRRIAADPSTPRGADAGAPLARAPQREGKRDPVI